MMGTEKAVQIICHLLELLKDNRRLPAPAGCPVEVRPPPSKTRWGSQGNPAPVTPPSLSPGLRADAELLGFLPRHQTHFQRAGAQNRGAAGRPQQSPWVAGARTPRNGVLGALLQPPEPPSPPPLPSTMRRRTDTRTQRCFDGALMAAVPPLGIHLLPLPAPSAAGFGPFLINLGKSGSCREEPTWGGCSGRGDARPRPPPVQQRAQPSDEPPETPLGAGASRRAAAPAGCSHGSSRSQRGRGGPGWGGRGHRGAQRSRLEESGEG